MCVHLVVWYVPVNSTPFGNEFVCVLSVGVQASTHSQNKPSSISIPIDSIPSACIRYMRVSSNDTTLIPQPNPPTSLDSSLNIHPMQTHSKSKSYHAITTIISAEYFLPITEPTNIHHAMQHYCWATAVIDELDGLNNNHIGSLVPPLEVDTQSTANGYSKLKGTRWLCRSA